MEEVGRTPGGRLKSAGEKMTRVSTLSIIGESVMLLWVASHRQISPDPISTRARRREMRRESISISRTLGSVPVEFICSPSVC